MFFEITFDDKSIIILQLRFETTTIFYNAIAILTSNT